jgi:hypothetical protein
VRSDYSVNPVGVAFPDNDHFALVVCRYFRLRVHQQRARYSSVSRVAFLSDIEDL